MILDDLFKMQDKDYRIFEQKLIPTLELENFIGIRIPILRKYAKKIYNNFETKIFLNTLPHKYYDENLLHALLISEMNDYNECIAELNKFLPYVDNWSVCDAINPKILLINEEDTLKNLNKWINSNRTYSIRFGIRILMNNYSNDNFKDEYLNIPLNVNNDDYYVKMMISWYYATLLAKKWDSTIYIIENKLLNKWIHNKTICKAKESYRISNKKKNYLTNFKIK